VVNNQMLVVVNIIQKYVGTKSQ